MTSTPLLVPRGSRPVIAGMVVSLPLVSTLAVTSLVPFVSSATLNWWAASSVALISGGLAALLTRRYIHVLRQGVARLDDHESLLAAVAASPSAAWVVVDGQQRITKVSIAVRELLGYDASELIGQLWETVAGASAACRSHAEPGLLLTKHGLGLSVEWLRTPVAQVGTLIAIRPLNDPLPDLPAPEPAPDADWASRLNFTSSLMEASPDSVHIFDSSGQLMVASKLAETHFPLRLARSVDAWLKLWPPAQQEAAAFALDTARSGAMGRFDATSQEGSGLVFYWDVVVFSLCDRTTPAAPAIAVVARDITSHQLARMTVAEQAATMQSLVDSVVDGIITISPEAEIRSWNRAAEVMFGYKESEAMGRELSFIFPQADATRYATDLASALRRDGSRLPNIPIGVEGRHRDGHMIPLELTLTQTSLNNEPLFAGVIRDLRYHRRVEEEQIARLAAESANHAKSQFLANMSHEIRTPLGIILGYARMLGTSDITEAKRLEYAATILRNGNNLLALLNDILDLSKVEGGHLCLETSDLDLAAFLADLVNELRVKASEKGLDLRFTYDSAIPETIITDTTRLRQVLLNILANALKFTTGGHIALNVSYQPAVVGQSALLTFSIADTGCGIPEHCHDLVFTPFTQADATVNRKYGGTGLGLSLSRRLARLLGGDLLLVRSVPQAGSEFMITINPGSLEQVPLIEPLLQMPVPAAAAAFAPAPSPLLLQNVRILVVEDFEDNQALIELYLEKAGAKVDIAENGLEAVQAVARQNYDVILMDIQMPVMNGYLATQQLRSSGVSVPIIALTAHAMEGERHRCFAEGFSAYLSKPLGQYELVHEVKKLLPTAPSEHPPVRPVVPRQRSPLLPKHDYDQPFASAARDFLSRLPLRLASMRVMAVQAEWQNLASVIRQIRGATASYRLHAIMEQAAKIEDALHANPQSAALALMLADLDTFCQQARTQSMKRSEAH